MKRLILTLFVFMIMVPMTTAMAHKSKYERNSYARDNYGDTYATVKLGVFKPNDHDEFLDNGFAVGGAVGHNFNRNFALEIGLDSISTEIDNGYDFEDVDVITLGIPVTAKFVIPLSNQVELYAGGGLGLYFTNVESYDEYYDGYYYDDDVDGTSLGLHTLIGADIKMNSNIAFNMELKHTEVEQDFDDYYYDDLEVGGTTASVGVKFLF